MTAEANGPYIAIDLKSYDASVECVERGLDLFSDLREKEQEHHLQKAIIGLQKRYRKNIILKGHDFLTGATTRERNGQIGGHRAAYG